MNEEKYIKAREETKKILKSMLVGFIGFGVVGVAVSYVSGDTSFILFTAFMLGLGFMGMPYVWGNFPSVVLNTLIGNLIWLVIKLTVSAMLGFVITPMVLIVQLMKMMIYRPKDTEANTDE